jgi:hypothetical protein
MLLQCRVNRGEGLPEELVARHPQSRHSRFKLTVGDRYSVFALAIFEQDPWVLVINDSGMPHWFYLALFGDWAGTVPPDWLASVSAPEVAARTGRSLLLGYRAMIEDAGHYEGLIDRRFESLTQFVDAVAAGELLPREATAVERLRTGLSGSQSSTAP